MRRLLCKRRRVTRDTVSRYLELWVDLRQAAASVGIHAWLFRSADDACLYMEFLEAGDARALADPTVRQARRALDPLGHATTEEWIEARTPATEGDA